MGEKDNIAERGRALEDEYFRRRDKELIEKMRLAAASERARAEMGEKTGLTDPEMLRQLDALGFTPDTVALLPLVPAVQMAWAEGGVSAAERRLILELARARGIEEGGAADRRLTAWLDDRPGEGVFALAMRLIRAMLASSEQPGLTADDLVKDCEAIAAASGGVFGINRVSGEERQLLTTLAEQLKAR